MKTKAQYIVPIIYALADCGVNVTKEQADYFSDYVELWCRDAVIEELSELLDELNEEIFNQ
ncbi:hypothetical protein NO1_1958 [Candidatus Termititenax aidoneus]|uniref:Uncharacterized protein n=1 Tax=Termititenax aidoneus TaxID=2218524 RepID=A0A388TD65_TERA1|nr:hypothetical protein NO1_1958 [Candidatus Termititenax aidoneus]